MRKRNMYIDEANEDWADNFDKATRLPAILLTLSVFIGAFYVPTINWLNYESISMGTTFTSSLLLGGMLFWRVRFDNIFGFIFAEIATCISLIISSSSAVIAINGNTINSVSSYELSIVLVPAICTFLAIFFCQWLFACEQKFTRENGTVEQRFCVSNI